MLYSGSIDERTLKGCFVSNNTRKKCCRVKSRRRWIERTEFSILINGDMIDKIWVPYWSRGRRLDEKSINRKEKSY